jgi:hypothetical protein
MTAKEAMKRLEVARATLIAAEKGVEDARAILLEAFVAEFPFKAGDVLVDGKGNQLQFSGLKLDRHDDVPVPIIYPKTKTGSWSKRPLPVWSLLRRIRSGEIRKP